VSVLLLNVRHSSLWGSIGVCDSVGLQLFWQASKYWQHNTLTGHDDDVIRVQSDPEKSATKLLLSVTADCRKQKKTRYGNQALLKAKCCPQHYAHRKHPKKSLTFDLWGYEYLPWWNFAGTCIFTTARHPQNFKVIAYDLEILWVSGGCEDTFSCKISSR